MLGSHSAAGVFDQDAPHGGGGRTVEVPGISPLLVFITHEAEPGFVDKRGGLEGLVRTFVGHSAGRELTQFGVYERQQFCCRVWFTALDSRENACDLAHTPQASLLFIAWIFRLCKQAQFRATILSGREKTVGDQWLWNER